MEQLSQIGIVAVIWWILIVIADWKLFAKAGIPGWHSLVPILNIFDRLGRMVLGFGSARYVRKRRG